MRDSKIFQYLFTALLGAGVVGVAAGAVQSEIQQVHFKVVGTWSHLTPWKAYEEPLWAGGLAEASGGKLTGKATPNTELGLNGGEVMRLLKLGVFDIAHGVFGYVSKEDAAIEAIDLSSVAKDFTMARAVGVAYRDTMDQLFQKVYNAKILAIYTWPSSMIFCRDPITKLSDLKGRKVRTNTATLADFIQGAGGVVTTIAFAEVVPALEKGVADCAITDPMSAYQASWHEVTSHLFILRVGYTQIFAAISLKQWNKLNQTTKNVLVNAFEAMEDEAWAGAEAQDAMGIACLTGHGECMEGSPGNMTRVDPSDEDHQLRRSILEKFVLKNWAERCGADCVKRWNATAGKAAGLSAPSP